MDHYEAKAFIQRCKASGELYWAHLIQWAELSGQGKRYRWVEACIETLIIGLVRQLLANFSPTMLASAIAPQWLRYRRMDFIHQ